MDAFGVRLREDRARIGMSVRQLAARTGVSFSYITKIETGRAGKGISPEIITTLAEALRADVLEYLFLSKVVPSPLHELLSDRRSREFLRRLTSRKVSASSWSQLQDVLSQSRNHYVTTNRAKRISTAQVDVEVSSGR